MKNKKYIILAICMTVYIFFLIGQGRMPVEELDIINGLSYDLKINNKENIDYLINYSAYVYNQVFGKETVVYGEEGINLGEVHENKQRRTNKKIVQGQEKLILISDEYAQYGLNSMMDERVRNPEYNDNAYVAVSHGMAQDYLTKNAKDYMSSADFIYGLLDNSASYNFFSKEFKVMDMYVRIYAEGRDIVLPYLAMDGDDIKIDGLALFEKDKMIANIDMSKTKILNLLRNDNVKGILTIEKNYLEYIDIYAESKNRSVQCYKDNDKYKFVINLNLNSRIVNNELYKGATRCNMKSIT